MKGPVDRGEVRFIEAALGVSGWAARVRSAAQVVRAADARPVGPAGGALADFFLGILALERTVRGFSAGAKPAPEEAPAATEPLDPRVLLR